MVKLLNLFYFVLLFSTQLTAQNTSNNHFYIISDNMEDSMFCAKHFPYYNFDNESIIYGIMTHEKSIQGKDMPLIDILYEVKNQILQRFSSFPEAKILSISILVDKNGKVRGGITNKQQESDYLILRCIFDLIKEYKYVPAYNRGKPITFCFSFIVKMPYK